MARDKERPVEEWKEKLTGPQFEVCFRAATEPPFSGEYNDHKGEGTYNCVACGTSLFESTTKFNSGSGWPSFFRPAEDEAVAAARGPQPRDDPYRGEVRGLWRSPRPRLSRWAAAHRASLLHQFAFPRFRGSGQLGAHRCSPAALGSRH